MSSTNGNLGRAVQHLRRWAAAGAATELSDPALVQRFIAARDECAFAELVKRHGPMVLGLCRRIVRHAHDAEDAFQATFLVLARKARSIRKQESVGGWLHSVAFRVANKLRAAQARRTARERPLPDPPHAPCTADLRWGDVQLAVDEELHRLPDKYRAPLLLCYLQGKTRDEAAQQLGWTPGVFRGVLERGRDLLRKRLTRRGLSLSAALLSLGIANTGTAGAMPMALATVTVQAVLGAASSTAAGGVVSASVAALTQGVIHAMFMTKLKAVVLALVTLTLVGSGTGLVGYRTFATEPASAVAASSAQTQSDPQASKDPQKLQQEIDRLRRELAKARAELEVARAEILLLKVRAEHEELAAREAAAKALQKANQELAAREAAAKALSDLNPLLQKDPTVPKEKAAPPTTPGLPAILDTGPKTASPDGRKVAIGQQRVIHIYDLQTGKELFRSQGHTAAVSALAFSPDGKLLASGDKDKTVRVWEATTGRQIRLISVSNPVTVIVFSADGKTLVIHESDMTLRVFDARTGKEIYFLNKKATP